MSTSMKGRTYHVNENRRYHKQIRNFHRSLHYWEDTGILTCTRGENGYRYYDEENIRRIKQIVLLRKLRLSIPSICRIRPNL